MKVIKNCGGEWKRGPQCHVFSGDPRVKLGLTLATGVAMDSKKAFQFFPTPPELATIVAIRAHVRGCSVLEPSAGHGALVKACIAEGANRVAMVELNPDNLPYLRTTATSARGVAETSIHCADFLTLTPDNAPIGHRCQFERIVMNPPFNKGQDLKHIAHAVTHWLRPGGELAAIMLPHTDEDISKALGGGRFFAGSLTTFAVGPPRTSTPAPSRNPAPTSAPNCCCWRKAPPHHSSGPSTTALRSPLSALRPT